VKLHKAKRMCFAIHYGEGVILNWKSKTVDKMERHRAKYNRNDAIKRSRDAKTE